ncbi:MULTISPECIES: hypothetical protein [Bosea]|jgi:hypothetical protein|uniref:hypothetical protein n=1 Tax=Bosea TaxID=85413 RepID=UPI002150242B|nr:MULTISPECIES: hypothetical protein [Bosea]MCR4524721.1 hypothetical protein [Bosea sp. 47.2.35]MDR6831549.1 hypothetical protein [Bosea robiniae]MDR6898258.1 hypothetical protein [Bosea sp. BE109]MDR7141655.1 hypothetical protein [Bosea sp. BE168]MDR7178288.1 hypothetical protein [Bosea sp. BE271]
MKTAKAKGRKVTDRRSAEEIQRAFSARAEEVAADHVVRPRYGWEVVAINVQTIDKLRLLEKDWGEIADELRQASGFPDLAANSVRVNRSRLGTGFYDDKLGALGLCRVNDRIEPIRPANPQSEGPNNVSEATPTREPTGPTVGTGSVGGQSQASLSSPAVLDAAHETPAVGQALRAGVRDHREALPAAAPAAPPVDPASAGDDAENDIDAGASAPRNPDVGGSPPTSRASSGARFQLKTQPK